MSFLGKKFGRICQLTVETAPDSTGKSQHLTIPSDPANVGEFTIEFNITRLSYVMSQSAQFRIHKLRPVTRDAIYKDQYDWSQFRAIQFRAGYGTFMPQIFNGTVLQAYSEKDGDDTVTVIDAFDGGFPMTNGYIGLPTNSGGPNAKTAGTVINELAVTMPGTLGPPVIGNFPVANMRGEVIFGNTWGLICQKSNGLATISDGVVYALQLNEGILGGEVTDVSVLDATDPRIPVISSDTGLLNAPRRSGTMVEWDILFEPRLAIFQWVNINSEFNKNFNGCYKVMGIMHRGVVSKAIGGEYVTTGKFFYGKGNAFSGALAEQIGA
jgi:hypothetical protein